MKPLLALVVCVCLVLPVFADGEAFESVDGLLEAIEHADEGVRTLSATVQYDRHLEFQDDRILRRGTLYFIADEARRKFAVRFEKRYVDNIERDEDETIIFDGRWYVERREEIKQFVRREVARENDAFDPLKLGEGPFPIPIGQDKADILRVYHATMPDAMDGLDSRFAGFVQGTYQLHLVPRRLEGEDLIDIRLWYMWQGDQLVPRLARTENARGDVTHVQLINLVVNGEIDREALRVDPPNEADGWKVQETRLPAVGAGG